MRQKRLLATLLSVATTAATILIGLEVAPASATTRLRSGTLHAQLATHLSSSSGPGAPAGANVMAMAVGTLALVALSFVVVTLIRRRFTPA